ncbi:MAG: hypothetical protein QM526_01225 [Alphaproteobacteria bacterium]|nr:hypothetical protein [Alphaproteobacteria bacterium]
MNKSFTKIASLNKKELIDELKKITKELASLRGGLTASKKGDMNEKTLKRKRAHISTRLTILATKTHSTKTVKKLETKKK